MMFAFALVFTLLPAEPILDFSVPNNLVLDFSEESNAITMVIRDDNDYTLAKELYRYGFYEASLDLFLAILNEGPSHPRFVSSVEWLFFLSTKMQENPLILSALAQFRFARFPDKYQDAFYYLVAKHFYLEDVKQHEKNSSTSDMQLLDFGALDFKDTVETSVTLDDAIDYEQETLFFSNKVNPRGSYANKALFLKGLSFYLHEHLEQAQETWQTVFDTCRITSSFQHDSMCALTALNMGRLYYEKQQYEFAGLYYQSIPSSSSLWIRGIFESAWVYYKQGNDSKAMGQIMTLEAPYFPEYYPEMRIIKASIYADACRYTESKNILAEFIVDAEAKQKKIHTLLEQWPNDRDLFLNKNKFEPMLMPEQLTLQEQAIAQLQEQQKKLSAFKKSQKLPFDRNALSSTLNKLIESKEHMGGFYLRSSIQTTLDMYQDLITQALALSVDVTHQERLSVESHHNTLMFRPMLQHQSLNSVAWPFQGEYWKDELGLYWVHFDRCQPHESLKNKP